MGCSTAATGAQARAAVLLRPKAKAGCFGAGTVLLPVRKRARGGELSADVPRELLDVVSSLLRVAHDCFPMSRIEKDQTRTARDRDLFARRHGRRLAVLMQDYEAIDENGALLEHRATRVFADWIHGHSRASSKPFGWRGFFITGEEAQRVSEDAFFSMQQTCPCV